MNNWELPWIEDNKHLIYNGWQESARCLSQPQIRGEDYCLDGSTQKCSGSQNNQPVVNLVVPAPCYYKTTLYVMTKSISTSYSTELPEPRDVFKPPPSTAGVQCFDAG